MSDMNPRDEMRQNALRSILTEAFFSWPSAVTIGLTIVAFFSGISLFPWWQSWMWLVVGTILEVIYLVTTLSDPNARAEAVSKMLTAKYDPQDIKNLHARQQLRKALEYKRSIDEFVAKQTGPLRVDLEGTSAEIEDWIGLIYRLARSIDQFESNTIIRRDRQTVPTELTALERRLKVTEDPSVRAEIERAIETRRSLLEDLKRVGSQVQRTEIKMETTVSQLSAVYTKLQLIDSRELDSGRARRLQDEIHDEVSSLNDIVDAMDEIYARPGIDAAVTNLSRGSASANAEDEVNAAQDSEARTARRSK